MEAVQSEHERNVLDMRVTEFYPRHMSMSLLIPRRVCLRICAQGKNKVQPTLQRCEKYWYNSLKSG
jgi:hypothetical protein